MNDDRYLRSIKDIEQVELRRVLICLGYSKDEGSHGFSELFSGDVTLPVDYRID